MMAKTLSFLLLLLLLLLSASSSPAPPPDCPIAKMATRYCLPWPMLGDHLDYVKFAGVTTDGPEGRTLLPEEENRDLLYGDFFSGDPCPGVPRFSRQVCHHVRTFTMHVPAT